MQLLKISAGFLLLFSLGALGQYKNVALNTADVRAAGKGYPHASSNSEYPCIWTPGVVCTPDTSFLALSAIDGKTKNDCHGSLACASWGPQLTVPGLWWRVDFGHNVEVDTVVIWIRHDFPHDSYWKDATLIFSDSSKVLIHPDSVAKPQKFGFTKETTNSLTIGSLTSKDATKWCSFTEVQVWGIDASTSITNSMITKVQRSTSATQTICNFGNAQFTHVNIPSSASGFELFSPSGRIVLRINNSTISNSQIWKSATALPKGIYRIRFF